MNRHYFVAIMFFVTVGSFIAGWDAGHRVGVASQQHKAVKAGYGHWVGTGDSGGKMFVFGPTKGE